MRNVTWTTEAMIPTVLEGDEVYCRRCDCFTRLDSLPIAEDTEEPVIIQCDYCRALLYLDHSL